MEGMIPNNYIQILQREMGSFLKMRQDGWDKALHLFIVQRELLGDEMPATGTSQALLMAYEKAKKPVSRSQRSVKIVTALSTAAIIVSFSIFVHWVGR